MQNTILQYVDLQHYPFVVLVLFTVWLLAKKDRKTLSSFLESWNILAGVVGLLFCLIGGRTYMELRVENGHLPIDMGLLGVYMGFLAGFFHRKLRKSWGYSIVFGLLLSYESIVVFVTGLHRDYLPTSWDSFLPSRHILIQSGIFLIAALILHQARRGKVEKSA